MLEQLQLRHRHHRRSVRNTARSGPGGARKVVMVSPPRSWRGFHLLLEVFQFAEDASRVSTTHRAKYRELLLEGVQFPNDGRRFGRLDARFQAGEQSLRPSHGGSKPLLRAASRTGSRSPGPVPSLAPDLLVGGHGNPLPTRDVRYPPYVGITRIDVTCVAVSHRVQVFLPQQIDEIRTVCLVHRERERRHAAMLRVQSS